jgi:hypothetical protein
MKTQPFAVAALTAIVPLALPGATDANPTGRAFVRPRTTRPAATRRTEVRGRKDVVLCTTQGSISFVVAGSDNVAGGYESSVLAGEGNQACDDDTAIGAGIDNTIGNSDNASYSFIGGGYKNEITGGAASIAGGEFNSANGLYSSVVGGNTNIAQGPYAFIGAGAVNLANGTYSSVVDGYENTAQGSESFVGAGGANRADGSSSVVGGGLSNAAAGSYSFLGAGQTNSIGSAASDSVIAGGARNNTTAEYAIILGGYGNNASGAYALVAGGDSNTASGTLTFSGGYHADAAHDGSFVWSDYSSGSKLLKDTATNQFLVRASGGAYFYSNEAATSGVRLGAGSGSWASLSDRGAKTDVAALDDDAILEKVATLPIDAWRYKTELGVRHMGPMAQDFYAAFGVGEDDRHITSIDEDGVALAAIKGLDAKLDRKSGEVAALHRENARLRAKFDALELRDANVERRLDAVVARLHMK